MSTIDLLKQNWKEGVRLPYPADDESKNWIRNFTPVAQIGSVFLFNSGLWERGERLYLTARNVAFAIVLQLQTRKEINAP